MKESALPLIARGGWIRYRFDRYANEGLRRYARAARRASRG